MPWSRLYGFHRKLAHLYPMAESRRAPRHHVLKAGTIKFAGRGINCLVRNLSTTGAALEVPNQAGIPARFILVVPGDGLHLPCRIVWRREHRIGIVLG
jgi:PilZ domain